MADARTMPAYAEQAREGSPWTSSPRTGLAASPMNTALCTTSVTTNSSSSRRDIATDREPVPADSLRSLHLTSRACCSGRLSVHRAHRDHDHAVVGAHRGTRPHRLLSPRRPCVALRHADLVGSAAGHSSSRWVRTNAVGGRHPPRALIACLDWSASRRTRRSATANR
jgi:hypothetical protein